MGAPSVGAPAPAAVLADDPEEAPRVPLAVICAAAATLAVVDVVTVGVCATTVVVPTVGDRGAFGPVGLRRALPASFRGSMVETVATGFAVKSAWDFCTGPLPLLGLLCLELLEGTSFLCCISI